MHIWMTNKTFQWFASDNCNYGANNIPFVLHNAGKCNQIDRLKTSAIPTSFTRLDFVSASRVKHFPTHDFTNGCAKTKPIRYEYCTMHFGPSCTVIQLRRTCTNI